VSGTCAHCGATGLAKDQISMSSDGWLCDPCFKKWDRSEAAKTPRPLFEDQRPSLNIEDLAPISEADFIAGQRARGLRWVIIGVLVCAVGAFGTSMLLGWLRFGGVIPSVIGGSPLVVIVGLILATMGALDWRKHR
jgi:hypothetical protein